MLVNLYSEDLKLLANYRQQIPLQYIDYICKKENANTETSFFVFCNYTNDPPDP